VDAHGEQVLAGRAAVRGVGAVAGADGRHGVAFVAARHRGAAVVFQCHGAVLRQAQRLGEPLGVVVRAQRLGGLHAEALPGHEGVVVVAVQGGNVLGRAGGEGVW